MMHDPNDVALRRQDAVRGLVSVVIPAYNAGRWLAETLSSVQAQTHGQVETIVADDGSIDDTAGIAARLGARVVHVRGAGPGGARNAGMAAARGEFLQFLDADDLLAPPKVARQVTLLEATGADVAWEPFRHLVAASSPNAGFVLGRHVIPELGDDVAASLLTARGFIQIGALLVRRTAVTDSVWFAPGPEPVEDVRYMMALAMAGARFASSQPGDPGLLFRQHAGPRHSARPMSSFARSCAANAAWAQAYWESHGGLTAPRRAALGEAYAFAARQLAALDPVAFADVAARGLAVGPEFTRQLPARVRMLSRLVGYSRAERIASSWRRLRRSGGVVLSGRP